MSEPQLETPDEVSFRVPAKSSKKDEEKKQKKDGNPFSQGLQGT